MLQVGEVVISADVEDIVSQIQEDVGLLRDVNELESDIMVTCPIHKGGMESTPSLGINKSTGVVHCFTCGYKGDIVTLVSDCYNIPYSQAFRKLVGDFVYSSRRTIDIDLGTSRDNLQIVIPKTTVYNAVWDNAPALAYLADRGINATKLGGFTIGYDKTHDVIQLYTRDLQGNYVICKARCIHKKLYLNSTGANKAHHLFGAYELLQSDWQPADPVWICESEIDALTLWGRGEYAVAIMGSHISIAQKNILLTLGVRRVVDGMDKDDAGRLGWDNIKKWVKFASTYDTIYPVDKKDINELTDEEFAKIKIK